MSTLSKIRENVGLVIIIIAISLGAFIFVDFFKNIGQTGDSTIGEVFGNEIEYQEFSEKFELYTRNSRGAEDADSPAKQNELREQAWQDVVREKLFEKEWEETGIMLPEEELSMMFFGPITHPYVLNFYLFKDSTGRFSPGQVQYWFNWADEFELSDPNINDQAKSIKMDLINLRRAITMDRKSSKWTELIAGGTFISDKELEMANEANSKQVDISYVSVPYSTVPDAEAKPSAADFASFYEKHKEAFYRDQPEVKLKYVWFPVNPTKADSMEIKLDISDRIEEFAEATDAVNYGFTSSDPYPVDSSFRTADKLPAALQATLGQPNKVVGPLWSPQGYTLLRLGNSQVDSAVATKRVRHILVQIAGGDSAAARSKLSNLQSQATANNFPQLAADNSDDIRTGPKGGDLGYIAGANFGPTFAADLAKAEKGSIFTTESPQGFHLVYVEDVTYKQYQVAELFREVTPSADTRDSVNKRASLYWSDVTGGMSMDKALEKYPEAQTRTSGFLSQSSSSLTGVSDARNVIIQAFKAEEGMLIQKIVEVGDAYVVAKVLSKGEEGYRELDEIKEEITPAVTNWVKAKKIKSRLGSGADLNAIASTYGAGATVGSATNITFNSTTVGTLGPEPKVVGRASGMAQGEVSQPIAGNNGVYVIKVNRVGQVTPMQDAMKQIMRTQILRDKVVAAQNASFLGLRDLADIKDYRFKFEDNN